MNHKPSGEKPASSLSVSTAGGGGVGGLLSFEALLDGASKDHGFASGGRPLVQLVPAMKSVS